MGLRDKLSEKLHCSSSDSHPAPPPPIQTSDHQPYNASYAPPAQDYRYQMYYPSYSAPPQSHGYEDSAPMAPQGLPYYPWVTEFDHNSGQYYYVNGQTGERSWQAPSVYDANQYSIAAYTAPAVAPVVAPAPPVDPSSIAQQRPPSGDADRWANFDGRTSELSEKVQDNRNVIGDGISPDFPENSAHGARTIVGTVEGIPNDIEDAPQRASKRWERIKSNTKKVKDNMQDAFESGEEGAEDTDDSGSESGSDDDDDDGDE